MFLPNFPEATFIPGATFIPESRVEGEQKKSTQMVLGLEVNILGQSASKC